MRSALLRGRHDVGGWLRATHGPPPHRQLRSGHSRTVVVAMARPWRPDVNDVDREGRGIRSLFMLCAWLLASDERLPSPHLLHCLLCCPGRRIEPW